MISFTFLMPWLMVGLIVGLLLVALRSHRIKRAERAWCPEQLKNSTLVYAEHDFMVRLHDEKRTQIMGRPDQVFCLQNNEHVPVEYKTRGHFMIYPSDEAQLGLYAFILRQNGLKTADHGYMVIENRDTGERRTLKVSLVHYHDSWALNVVSRFNALMQGATPEFTFTPKCKGCGHKPRCHDNSSPLTFLHAHR